MKLYYYVFVLILCSAQAQSRKTSFLTKGEIVFRQATVVDTAKFMESVDKLRQLLIKNAIAEGLPDSLAVSAAKNIALAELFVNGVDSETIHHVYRDSVIVAFKKDLQGLVRGDYSVINIATKNYHMLAKADSVTVYKKKTPYEYTETVETKEFRDHEKKIHGYNCFRVTVRSVDYTAGEMFAGAAAAETLWELWVTPELQSNFHPVIRFQAVLGQYYPLYISSTSTLLEGVKTIAEVSDVKLK